MSTMAVYRSRCCTPITCEYNRLMPLITQDNYPNRLSKSLNISQPRNIYNIASDKVTQRFSPGDWFCSNSANYELSEVERNLSNRIRGDCWRAVKETDARTKNRQAENTRKLGARVQDIAFWKSELNDEIKAMETEMAALDEHRGLLARALEDTIRPLQIAQDCLLARENRKEIDKVHDDVERNLSKEVILIRNVQDKLKKFLLRCDAQQKLNAAACNNLENDASDKHHAQHLDERLHMLRNASNGLSFHPGIEAYDNTVTNPLGWINFTRNNIHRSQKERERSEKLRGLVDQLLRQAANQMWHSFNNVNNAFNERQQELADARNKLMAHLNRTNQSIFDMEKNIELIKRAIADKEAPLKVAQTRLEERTRRINIEACRDESMLSLIREVKELKDSIRFLNDKLCEAEAALARLNRTKATLEHDLALKENSIAIDSNCMSTRKSFPMESSTKVGPLLTMPSAY